MEPPGFVLVRAQDGKGFWTMSRKLPLRTSASRIRRTAFRSADQR
jgi:hypothetical protein